MAQTSVSPGGKARIHRSYGRGFTPPGMKHCALCYRLIIERDLIMVFSEQLQKHVWVCKKGWFNHQGKCAP